MKRSELRRDTPATRAFLDRGRESSAKSLRNGHARSKNGNVLRPWGQPMKRRKVKVWGVGRRKVLSEGRCRVCGTVYALDPHHAIYRSRGGSDDERNCVPLCRTHHDAVHNHGLDLWDFLTDSERAYAIEQTGSEYAAREQLVPSQAYKREAA